MSKPKTDLVQRFEKFTTPTPPQDAATMERLATHGRGMPQQGYVKEVAAATNRGREIMDAGKRGERNFPPAREVVK